MGLHGLGIARAQGETALTQGETPWRRPQADGGRLSGTFRDGRFAPEMTILPAGSFRMGSPGDEPGRTEDEGPARMVEISESFAVGVTPVTFADWDAAVAEGWLPRHAPSDHGWGRGRRPVIDVNWQDAQAYVGWLSSKTGRSYRLLTEAEWEYAARAGSSEAYATGAGVTAADARFADGGVWDVAAGPAEVGTFPPNAFGLHDMHGNVWEWVEDAYAAHDMHGNPGEYPQPDRRVIRGGSWGVDRNWLRCACRGWLDAGLRNDDVGFRVARAL